MSQQAIYGYYDAPPLPCPACHSRRPWPAYAGTDGIKAELGHFNQGDMVQETEAYRKICYSSDPGPGVVIDIGHRMLLVSSKRGAFWYHSGNLEHREKQS